MTPELFELKNDPRRLTRRERVAVVAVLNHVLTGKNPLPQDPRSVVAVYHAIEKLRPLPRRRRRS